MKKYRALVFILAGLVLLAGMAGAWFALTPSFSLADCKKQPAGYWCKYAAWLGPAEVEQAWTHEKALYFVVRMDSHVQDAMTRNLNLTPLGAGKVIDDYPKELRARYFMDALVRPVYPEYLPSGEQVEAVHAVDKEWGAQIRATWEMNRIPWQIRFALMFILPITLINGGQLVLNGFPSSALQILMWFLIPVGADVFFCFFWGNPHSGGCISAALPFLAVIFSVPICLAVSGCLYALVLFIHQRWSKGRA